VPRIAPTSPEQLNRNIWENTFMRTRISIDSIVKDFKQDKQKENMITTSTERTLELVAIGKKGVQSRIDRLHKRIDQKKLAVENSQYQEAHSNGPRELFELELQLEGVYRQLDTYHWLENTLQKNPGDVELTIHDMHNISVGYLGNCSSYRDVQ
jgi:hypothetical protein